MQEILFTQIIPLEEESTELMLRKEKTLRKERDKQGTGVAENASRKVAYLGKHDA